MNSKVSYANDQFELCYGDKCVRAQGENAKILATGTAITLVLLGIACLVKAAKG